MGEVHLFADPDDDIAVEVIDNVVEWCLIDGGYLQLHVVGGGEYIYNLSKYANAGFFDSADD
jgi:hypothetical protein